MRFDYWSYRYTEEKKEAAIERWLKETNHVRVPFTEQILVVLRDVISKGWTRELMLQSYHLTDEQLDAVMENRWVATDKTPKALRDYLWKDELINQERFDTALVSHVLDMEVAQKSDLRKTFSTLLDQSYNPLSDDDTDYDRVTHAETIAAFFFAVREHYS